MKKVMIFSVCLLLVTGCDVEKPVVSTMPLETGYSFETAPDGARNYREIYEYSDGRKIISEFVSIKYTNDHKDVKNMELEDAIKNEVITIDDLINVMIYKDTANDGGSKLYQFGEDSSIYLVTCNTSQGNRDIIIGTNPDIVGLCQSE